MRERTVDYFSTKLGHVSYCDKKQKISNKTANTYPSTLLHVTTYYKTVKCGKKLLVIVLLLYCVLDCYKTQKYV